MAQDDTPIQNLREFYENHYERSLNLVNIPKADDYIYGQLFAQIRPYLKSKLKVLDLGCHTGALSLYIGGHGCDVIGIDLAKNAIEVAEKSAEKLCMKNVVFKQLDFIESWHQREIFDLVLCSHVVEHIPDDLKFVTKINSSLKPGGTLILLAPTRYSSLYRIHKLLFKKFKWDEEVGHLRRYDKKSFVGLVQNSGFEVEKIEFLDSVLREWMIVYSPLRWLNKFWSRKYIRTVFNKVDKILAYFLFPATICIHAKKKNS